MGYDGGPDASVHPTSEHPPSISQPQIIWHPGEVSYCEQQPSHVGQPRRALSLTAHHNPVPRLNIKSSHIQLPFPEFQMIFYYFDNIRKGRPILAMTQRPQLCYRLTSCLFGITLSKRQKKNKQLARSYAVWN